ncbi:hypothetical protein [Arcobacter sp. FWKO B]|uniref:hypothetical protein n=1 Tax=Arcobacter sp. FWKO B TaxID=2593672 RepID=UPI0018A3AD03|nr:hypothetical protein [Arcobacter sp. FWKO B]QOG13037.1 hypothetical protein FWKOB_10205 [Arcobacter sp. FWKO B]
MKFGFFGGAILLILTLVFAKLAMDTDRMTKEIVADAFQLEEKQIQKEAKTNQNVEQPVQAHQNVEVVQQVQVQKDDKWSDFDSKFDKFEEKFKNF